ncbi:Hypothetical protein PHPALM_37161, partial [Phytophthora palmivora]
MMSKLGKPRKERKPTHTLRKEQKMELLSQIEQLQDQLESLKSQAIVSNALHVKKHTQAPVMNAILRDAIANVEMSMSEVLGNITIREDDDNGDDNVTQLRLVTSTGSAPQAPPLETNSLQFNEFCEATTSGGPNGTATSEFGLIMADFVDEDELYPYRAQERMRKDVTAALLLTRLPKEEHRHIHGVGDDQTRTSDDGELIVKVTLWSLIKLHHSDLEVSYDCLEETRHEIDEKGSAHFEPVTTLIM